MNYPSEINIKDIVEYFNLEYGADKKSSNGFTEADFSFIGKFEVSGDEVYFWSVKNQELCATVQKYEDGYLYGMAAQPSN